MSSNSHLFQWINEEAAPLPCTKSKNLLQNRHLASKLLLQQLWDNKALGPKVLNPQNPMTSMSSRLPKQMQLWRLYQSKRGQIFTDRCQKAFIICFRMGDLPGGSKDFLAFRVGVKVRVGRRRVEEPSTTPAFSHIKNCSTFSLKFLTFQLWFVFLFLFLSRREGEQELLHLYHSNPFSSLVSKLKEYLLLLVFVLFSNGMVKCHRWALQCPKG